MAEEAERNRPENIEEAEARHYDRHNEYRRELVNTPRHQVPWLPDTWGEVPLQPNQRQRRWDKEICPICQMEFESGEDVCWLPCGHPYHRVCLAQFRTEFCPLCGTFRDDARNIRPIPIDPSKIHCTTTNESNRTFIIRRKKSRTMKFKTMKSKTATRRKRSIRRRRVTRRKH